MSFGAEHGTERSAKTGLSRGSAAARRWDATTVAVVVAGVASLVVVIVLLAATGRTNSLAVAFTCIAALSCLGGYMTATRRGGTGPPPESVQKAAPAPEAPVARDAGDGFARMALLEDAVELVDELDRHRESANETQRRLLDHVVARIAEILERSDVEVISGEDAFNRNRHAAADSAQARPGASIAETLSPGFIVDRRVLRRARVRLTQPQR